MSSLSTGSPPMVEEKPGWSMTIPWFLHQVCQTIALQSFGIVERQSEPVKLSDEPPCVSGRTCPLAPSYTKTQLVTR
jgi:hypothetical protein